MFRRTAGSPRAIVIMAAFLAVAAAVAVVGITDHPASAAGAPYSSAASARAGDVPAGATLSADVDVTAAATGPALVDVEVHGPDGTVAFQRFWEDEPFDQGSTRRFAVTWEVPDDAPVGHYTVKVGVFSPGWAALLHWNDRATTVRVVDPPPEPVADPGAPVEEAPADDATADQASVPVGGIATGTVLSSPLSRDMELIASIVPGGFVRSDYTWKTVQPRQVADPAAWSWAVYDARIDAIHAQGLEVLAMLGYSPAWANGGSADDKRPPTQQFTGHWQEFCHQFAKRYIPEGVTAFEVWNEPNLARFWTTGPNVATYVQRVLIPCTTGLRQAASALGAAITIVTGGTAPATNGRNIDPRTWVEGLYANGAAPYFDAIGHHPYTWPYAPSQNASMAAGSFAPNQWNAMVQTKDLRATMLEHHDGAKQIWATEVGLPSRDGAPGYPAAGHQNFVSSAQMVTRIDEIFAAWFGLPAAGDPGWAGPLIWYQHRDQRPAPFGGDTEAGFGVVDHAGADKRGGAITPRQALTQAFADHG